MKLLREINESVTVVTEARANGEGQDTYITGVFMQAEVKNQNGRVYPLSTLEREVSRYIQESVTRGTALGELGHPDNPSINLERVSHRIVELRRDGNNFVGKALITETPFGNIAKGLLRSGTKLGVSSRGLGSVQSSVVQEDFRLVTAADIVADPSAPEAWVQAVVEGVEWVYEPARGWVPAERLLERARRNSGPASSRAKLFEEYLIEVYRRLNRLGSSQ